MSCIDKMNSLLLAIKANKIGEIQRILTYSPSCTCRKLVNYQAPENNETPLFVASVRGYTGVARWLLTRGARVEVTTSWGATALHAAAERGHEAIIKLLVEKNIPLNLQTQYGDTALHLAAFRGHHRAVLVLLAAGIDTSITNSKGRTASDEAELAGHHIILKHVGYERLTRTRNNPQRSKSSTIGFVHTELLQADTPKQSHFNTQSPQLGHSPSTKYDHGAPNYPYPVENAIRNSKTKTSHVQDWVLSCTVPITASSTISSSQCTCDNQMDDDDAVFAASFSETDTYSNIRARPLSYARRKATMLKDIGKSQSCEGLGVDPRLPNGTAHTIGTTTASRDLVQPHARCRRVNSLERAMEELQKELRATREEMKLAKADISGVQEMMRLCWATNGASVNNRIGVNGQRYVVSPNSSEYESLGRTPHSVSSKAGFGEDTDCMSE